jgi:hypothetical protein
MKQLSRSSSRAFSSTSDSMRSDYRFAESKQVPFLMRNQDAKQIQSHELESP